MSVSLSDLLCELLPWLPCREWLFSALWLGRLPFVASLSGLLPGLSEGQASLLLVFGGCCGCGAVCWGVWPGEICCWGGVLPVEGGVTVSGELFFFLWKKNRSQNINTGWIIIQV